MSISFENPWYLLLIPVAALFLAITQRFMFTREKGSKIGQIVIRSILFLALILALSGFSLKFTGRSTTTIYLLDVSDSVRDSRQDIINFVNESVKNKKKSDNVGVIAFGEDTRVEQFVSEVKMQVRHQILELLIVSLVIVLQNFKVEQCILKT